LLKKKKKSIVLLAIATYTSTDGQVCPC